MNRHKKPFILLAIALALLLGLLLYNAIPGSQAWSRGLGWHAGRGMMGPDVMGRGWGPGMMGSDVIGQGWGSGMMMGHGMMGARNVSIDSEYDFLTHMIPHHAEAVATARYLQANTERERMREFAQGIIESQTAEIKLMRSWLESWYPDRSHTIDYRPMMRDLDGLRGEELDRIFIADMIPHHMEAVMMSQQLVFQGLADHDQVISLARSISSNQRREIDLMMSWTRERSN